MNSPVQMEIISALCKKHQIPLEVAGKSVEKLRDKENIFAIGVFEKYENALDSKKNHIVLVNPGDMGNMGRLSVQA